MFAVSRETASVNGLAVEPTETTLLPVKLLTPVSSSIVPLKL